MLCRFRHVITGRGGRTQPQRIRDVANIHIVGVGATSSGICTAKLSGKSRQAVPRNPFAAVDRLST